MTNDFILPELPQLERSHPEYVSKLEEGLVAISELVQQQESALMEVARDRYNNLITELKAIKGIEVHSSSDSYQEVSLDAIAITPTAVRAAIELLKKRTNEVRTDDRIMNAQELLNAAEERVWDFRNALTDLTQVVALYQAVPKHDHNHFYILRQEMIYAACALPVTPGKAEMFTIDFQPTDLDAETFTDQNTLADLIAEHKKENLSLYKVSNPSLVVPPPAMLGYALKQLYPSQDLN